MDYPQLYRLANKGFEVDLYEQNSTPGGKAGEIKERDIDLTQVHLY